jgi:membrane-associated protease RseP (regulator of RpoE activity)
MSSPENSLPPAEYPTLGDRRDSRKLRPLLHLGLFLGTVATTLIAGAMFHTSSGTLRWQETREVLRHPALWLTGAPYSFSVLAILLSHEMGHYLACRHYRIEASLPYFLPGIPILGTFGAFIRIRERITNRRALFDIGVAGPLSGFLVALPIFLYGMGRSRIMPVSAGGENDIYLGFPALFSLAVPYFFPKIPEGSVLSLSPYLSAAWVGMLATSLNLLPAGQLDGGHICYAISRRLHARMSRLTLISVILLGALHQAWVVWAVILLLLGDRHPPLLDEQESLSPGRVALAVVALIIFVLSFMPIPVQIPS